LQKSDQSYSICTTSQIAETSNDAPLRVTRGLDPRVHRLRKKMDCRSGPAMTPAFTVALSSSALTTLFTVVDALAAFFTPVGALATLFAAVVAFSHLLNKLRRFDCTANRRAIDDGRR